MGTASESTTAGSVQPLLARAFEDAFDRGPAVSPAVHVGIVMLSEWMPWLTQAEAFLDAADHERIARKRRERDRDALTLAYALHRLFLARLWRLEPDQVPLQRDGEGRPCLGAMPGCTSLSHSGDAAAFAYSPLGPVGVDVEPRGRAAGMADIAGRICHPHEYAALPAAAAARDEALLAIWVRKEAFLKAAGVGLACEMDGFSAPEQAVLHTRMAGAAAGAWVRLHALQANPSLVVAVAAPPELAVESWQLTPRCPQDTVAFTTCSPANRLAMPFA